MKTIKIAFLFAFSTLVMQAQNDTQFMIKMKSTLEMLQNAKTPDEIIKVTNQFDRIAKTEPNEWLPLYYCAWNNVSAAFQTNELKIIDELVDKAEWYLEMASEIAPDNSEIFTLKAMCMGARIKVDPTSRNSKFGSQADAFLETAKKLNQGNPRPYLYQAQSKFNTPEAFGGGKKVALSYLEKAMSLFTEFKPQNELMPNWGMAQAKSLMEKCKQ